MAPTVARGLLALLAASGTLFGCHDLTLPAAGVDAGRGPDVDIQQPVANDANHPLLLSSRVLIVANDADGVASVELFCGTAQIATLRAAPFDSLVDFSGCRPFVTAAVAPATLPTLDLDVIATDTLGHQSRAAAHVYFDARSPVLTTNLPPFVSPGGTLRFRVASAIALDGPPSARVGGGLATVLEAGDSDPTHPTFEISQTGLPQIGVDALAPGTPLTYEALVETSKTLPVILQATGSNGNVARLELSTELSRVRFDQPVPGIIPAVPAVTPEVHYRNPVAFARGLSLPLLLSPSSVTQFVPAFFGSDGHYEPFSDPNVINVSGNTPLALISTGAMVSSFFQTLVQVIDFSPAGDGGSTVSTHVTFDPAGTASAVLTEGGFCALLGSGGGTCVDELRCFYGDGGSNVADAPADCRPLAGTLAVPSGAAVLSLKTLNAKGAPFWDVGIAGQSLVIGPSTGFTLSGGTCGFSSVERVQPTGEGSFAMALVGNSALGAPCRGFFLMDSAGKFTASYAVPYDTVGANWRVVTALRDRSLVTFRYDSGNTVLERWSPDATKPDKAAIIPGLLSEFETGAVVWHTSASSYADGSFVVTFVAGVNVFRQAVLSMNAAFEPRYLYFYPRLTVSNPYLAAAEASELVYFVDVGNGHVLGLSR